jgi:hypothetical protein
MCFGVRDAIAVAQDVAHVKTPTLMVTAHTLGVML